MHFSTEDGPRIQQVDCIYIQEQDTLNALPSAGVIPVTQCSNNRWNPTPLTVVVQDMVRPPSDVPIARAQKAGSHVTCIRGNVDLHRLTSVMLHGLHRVAVVFPTVPVCPSSWSTCRRQ